MPYDPSGNFTRDYDWTTDRNNGVKVRADRMDGEFNNFATAMNQVLLRNGVAAMTGNMQMGGNSIVALADGSVGTPAIRFLGSPTTGFYSPGLDKVALTASGTNRVEANTTGVNLTGAVNSAGSLVVGGTTTLSNTLTMGGLINFFTSPGIIQAGGSTVLTLNSSGALTVTGALGVGGKTTTAGLYSSANAYVNSGSYLGLTGDGSLATALYSPGGNDFGLRVNSINRFTVSSGGDAAFTGNVYLAASTTLGLSGNGDTRSSITSPSGTSLTFRANNVNGMSIGTSGEVYTNNALNVGTSISAGTTVSAAGDVTSAGGLFSGGAGADANLGLSTRARSGLQYAARFADSTGVAQIDVRLNQSGVNGIASNQLFGISARGTLTDFQLATNGNVYMGAGVLGVGTSSPVTGAGFGHVTANGSSGSFYNAQVGGTTYGVFGALSSEMRLLTPNSTPIYMYTNNTLRMAITDSQTYFNASQQPSSPYAVGYLGIPQSGGAAKGANYTAVLSDAGQHIMFFGASLTGTIPSNAAVPYPVGTTLTFVNIHGTNLSIGINTDTLYMSGVGTTGTRTLASYGVATAIKFSATGWLISGPGLS